MSTTRRRRFTGVVILTGTKKDLQEALEAVQAAEGRRSERQPAPRKVKLRLVRSDKEPA